MRGVCNRLIVINAVNNSVGDGYIARGDLRTERKGPGGYHSILSLQAPSGHARPEVGRRLVLICAEFIN